VIATAAGMQFHKELEYGVSKMCHPFINTHKTADHR
jgi:hypothetical protein